MRFSVFASSAVAAIVGFGSTLALIVAAANVLGATQAETASWVTAVCLAIAGSSAWLSVRYKMPIIAAWSTPGLALIGASVGFTMPEAVGAFIVTALALILTGLVRQLSTLVSRIPASVASGMLAGVLLSFVIAAAKSVSLDPSFVLPLVALFFIIRLFNPSLAVIAVLVLGMAYALLTGRIPQLPAPEISTLTLIWPEFHIGAMIGIALPLYLVTMASQNLPGFAVLRASGYEPPTSAALRVTGLFSLLTAPVYAAFYVVFALFGTSLVAIFAVLPATLIALVAGLALMGPFINAMSLALKHEEERLAAIVTFAVTASGIAFFGVGSAFWALIAGLGVATLEHLRKKIPR
jgi:benzoate membrane transport protein